MKVKEESYEDKKEIIIEAKVKVKDKTIWNKNLTKTRITKREHQPKDLVKDRLAKKAAEDRKRQEHKLHQQRVTNSTKHKDRRERKAEKKNRSELPLH
jgi:hypothetical protein